MPSQQRARSFHRPQALVVGVLLATVCFLSALSVITSLACFLIYRKDPNDWLSGHQGWGLAFVASVLVYAFFKIWRYRHALNTSCPLCHGTFFMEKDCHMNRDARRIGFFSYSTTVILDLLFTGTYVCMYCGTPFRLKK